MSHHFDTKLAKEDPSLNVCDFYLFQGAPDTTVMAMTVNPDVVLSAPDTLHIEGLYAFRLDLTGDAREDVVFKFRFNEPRHVNGDEHVHVQKFQVRRATGEAIGGDKGELLIEGDTGKVHSKSGIRAFVGIAPDMFAADAVAMQSLQKAFYNEHRYDGDAFLRQSPELLQQSQYHCDCPRSPKPSDRQGNGPCLGHGVTLRPCSRDAGVTLGPADDHAPLSQRSRQSRGERDLQQIGAIR